MFQNKMTQEEKEDFLQKIQLHRPDAADDFYPSNSKLEEDEKRDEKKKEEPQSQNNQSSRPKRPNFSKDDIEKEFEKNTRDVLKNHFGMTDEELDRLDIGADKSKQKSKKRHPRNESQKEEQKQPDDDWSRDVEFMGGLNTSKDATNWKDFLTRAEKNYSARWEKIKNNRVESVQSSKKYNIEPDKHGEKFVLILLIAFMMLGYNEYTYSKME